MNDGAPLATPWSITAKSMKRLSAATMQITTLIASPSVKGPSRGAGSPEDAQDPGDEVYQADPQRCGDDD
jgi:hypothetical protein